MYKRQVFSAVDSGGNLVLLQRMEGALLGSVDVSAGKAYTANAFQMPTHELGQAARPDGPLYGICLLYTSKKSAKR